MEPCVWIVSVNNPTTRNFDILYVLFQAMSCNIHVKQTVRCTPFRHLIPANAPWGTVLRAAAARPSNEKGYACQAEQRCPTSTIMDYNYEASITETKLQMITV
ncbi:hypothetical protein CEXT_696841 [Caerostris extrusa]|uniref:Uncharacterized protein n=1 Tax=Caerostris extrusa TaxID=172846 RepID=A0AAV4T024_CAEEX|nr:hypothetical protein CEXT_696841 [Caerostris extrusa]